MARHAAIDQQDSLPGQAFAIEGRAGLKRGRDVVVNGDVFAHDLLAKAIGEAGALIEDGGSGKVVKEKADQIEDGGGFENDGPAAGLDFLGMARCGGFFAGALGEGFGIDLVAIGSAGFSPSGRIPLQNRDGKFRAALAIAGEESFGIGHRSSRSPGGKDPGGGLAILLGELGDFGDGDGAILRSGAGGRGEKAPDLSVLLRAGHGQQVGILGLTAGQRGRTCYGTAQRVIVGFVGGGAGGAAVKDGAHGNAERLLGDILVDGVVGEARESVGDKIDMHLGFVGIRKAKHALGEIMQFRIRG